MYADLELKLKAPPPNGDGTAKIDGDDLAYGFGLGALVELSEQTRIGVVYQSELEPDLDGDASLRPAGLEAATDTKITLARFIRVSGYHELNRRWAFLATVGWEDWSKFENINVSAEQGTQKIPRNWDDTWKFAAGVHFRPVDKWLLQFGIAYDTSPVDSDDRTADMPIDRQIRYGTGVQYKWSDKISIGTQFVYADYGSARIKNDNLLKGDYKANDLYFLSVNFNWKL
jgi:long-chain fatty acid transport protein